MYYIHTVRNRESEGIFPPTPTLFFAQVPHTYTSLCRVCVCVCHFFVAVAFADLFLLDFFVFCFCLL